MIIDPADFSDRPYKVPNQEESRDFTSFIENKENELAIKYLLGDALWTEFKTELAGTPAQKWIDLRDGATYLNGDTQYRYGGWVDMVRPAIFSEWLPPLTYKLTNVGYVANSTPQQAEMVIDQEPYLITRWNEFAAKVGYNANYWYNCVNTFYGFMKANESNYDDWVFQMPCFRNRHSL